MSTYDKAVAATGMPMKSSQNDVRITKASS